MLVQITNNRCARVSVKFGNDTPKLEKPLPPAAAGKQFRSVKIEVKVYTNPEMVGEAEEFSGESYCNPLDQFERFKGRKIAMLRLMSADHGRGVQARMALSLEDWHILCPVMLRGPAALG